MYTRRGSTERNNQIRDFNTKEALETVIDFECKSIAKIFEIRKFNYISNESKIKIKQTRDFFL